MMFCFGQSKALQAADLDTQALVKSFAGSLGYPASRITVTDMSDSPKAKARGGIIGLLLESKDGTFATLAIGVAKRGSILTPQFEAECEDAVKKGKSPENRVSKVDFGQGAYGYSGLGMLGPGGSGERIVAVWPERGIDLQLSVSVPGDGLTTDASVEAYQRLINDGGDILVQKLFDGLKHVFEQVQKSDLRVVGQVVANPSESNQPSVSVPRGQSQADAGAANPASIVTALEQPASSTPWSIIVVLIVAAIGLLWLLLKRRS
jgi:hypothetical protein